MDLRRLDPSTRNLLLDAGFILGTLVVALASFFVIRAATGSSEAPRADVAGVIATATARTPATPTASPTAQATTPSPTLPPTATATPSPSPTATPTQTATPEPTPAGLEVIAALGRDEPYVCEAGLNPTEDASKGRAVNSWNQLTSIWNRVVESEGRLNAAIPSPFTLENAAASADYLAEARRHQDVVLAAINDLVSLRASGIHTRTRDMSLRQGNFYDLERLMIQQTIAGAVNRNAELWNAAAFMETQRNSYLANARAEMQAVCDFVKQP